MSQESLPGARGLRLLAPMGARDPDEEHRAATPLELFFDLVFVVAVARAAERLEHALAEGSGSAAVLDYGVVFFAIWWAWMNFTWFASAYDTDDITFRVSVFVIMTGALVLAAGVPRAFDRREFTLVLIGYVVMRLALVTQWVRAARTDRERRVTASRYAIGVTACQVGWILAVVAPDDWWLVAFAVFGLAEMLVPVWAESASPTPWHPGHIAERYGLFTIIVLGESILAASFAIESAADGIEFTGELATILAGGLLIVFSMWWLYFDRPEAELRSSVRSVFLWGYGHFPIFASAAAVGAGLALRIEQAGGHGEHLSAVQQGLAIAIPVVVYLLGLWALHTRVGDAPLQRFGILVVAVLVPAAAFVPGTTLVVGLLLVTLVAIKVVARIRSRGPVLRFPD